MSANNQKLNLKLIILTTLIGSVVILVVGNIFSCSVYKFLYESNNPALKAFAKDVRSLFSNVGSYCVDEQPILKGTPGGEGPTSPTPPQDPVREEYLAQVRRAKVVLSAMSPDTPVKFPLGVNSPIGGEKAKSKANSSPNSTQLEAIGYVDKSGESKAITAADILEMIDSQTDALYNEIVSIKPKILVVNASNTFAQQTNGPVIDLIGYNPQTSQAYILPDVKLTYVCRDAINAALNGQLQRNDYDMSSLGLKQM